MCYTIRYVLYTTNRTYQYETEEVNTPFHTDPSLKKRTFS